MHRALNISFSGNQHAKPWSITRITSRRGHRAILVASKRERDEAGDASSSISSPNLPLESGRKRDGGDEIGEQPGTTVPKGTELPELLARSNPNQTVGDTWDILSSPGLTPPRAKQRSGSGAIAAIGRAVWRRLSAWFPALASLELLRRLAVTFAMLWLIRLGNYIPVPGLNVPLALALAGFLRKGNGGQAGGVSAEGAGVLAQSPSGAALPAGAEQTDVEAIASLTSKITGATELPGSVYLLSITPYMTAHFFLGFLQLLPEVRRHFKVLRDRGRSGQDTINGYVNTLFVVFALMESFWQSGRLVPLSAAAWSTSDATALATGPGDAGLKKSPLSSLHSIAAAMWMAVNNMDSSTAVFRLQTMVTLLAGAVICKYVVQTIDQFGLGDGTGIIIGASIAIGYWQHTKTMVSFLVAHQPSPIALSVAIALVLALVAMVVWVQGIELRLPLTSFVARQSTFTSISRHPVLQMLSQMDQKKKEKAHVSQNDRSLDLELADGAGGKRAVAGPTTARMYQHSLLPLRLSPAGTRQLLFANFWVSLLDRPLNLLGLGGLINMTNPFVFATLVFFLEAVSLADATPRQTAEFLMQSDTGIIGLSPGPDTEEFLKRRRRQMKLLNAAFVAGVSLAARAVDAAFLALTGVRPDCLSLLLLVSTVLGGARQIDALSEGVKVDRLIDSEYALLERAIPSSRVSS